MRNDSWVTSAQYSDASSLAMPASTSLRMPASLSRAALTISACEASTLVAISASLHWIAWGPVSGVADERLAEGRGRLGVRDGERERADRDAARTGRDVDAADLDAVHHLVEAA